MTDEPGRAGCWKAVMGVLLVAETASAFESSMTLAALPTFYKLFHDPASVGWVITAYLLVAAAATAICGRLGDIYGRSRVLLVLLATVAAMVKLPSALVAAVGAPWGGALAGRGGARRAMLVGTGLAQRYAARSAIPVRAGTGADILLKETTP